MGRAMVELAAALGAPGIRVLEIACSPEQIFHQRPAGFRRHSAACRFRRACGVECGLRSHGAFASARETLSVVRASGCVNTGVVWDPLNAYSEFARNAYRLARAAGLPVTFISGRHTHPQLFASDRGPVMWGDGDFPALALVALLVNKATSNHLLRAGKSAGTRFIPAAEIALAAVHAMDAHGMKAEPYVHICEFKSARSSLIGRPRICRSRSSRVYMLAMLGVGCRFHAGSTREHRIYFKGGNRIPWLVAG